MDIVLRSGVVIVIDEKEKCCYSVYNDIFSKSSELIEIMEWKNTIEILALGIHRVIPRADILTVVL